ncbi:MFS transporter [Sedimentibacter hydroxybenzoicus DSM 7310]|uniref:MFS transporter n=1 Tax=Sedimentibacter hydroxybenzoicus DSM 7310 TaxID=1123245 RepID=A0A974GUY1_SEDHY|nr:MFS transporter [Sedimentibacter hydroxybenzoicus]NYB72729.1 MFS transporter [Sedimentibacter hydroxybenzoicus DSM 7310]
MKKVSVLRFYIMILLINAMNCVILPILPTIYKNLNLPDYMFGIAFGFVAAGMFLFSPFWGRVGDKLGHTNTLIITSLGYAAAQLMLFYARGTFTTLVARFLGGSFAGGIMVAFLAYVTNSSAGGTLRTKHMSYYAAILSLSNSLGYFIGGVMGSYSIALVFAFQIVVLILCCLYLYFFVGEPETKCSHVNTVKSINPFVALIGIREVATKTFIVFLIAVFLTTFATISFDNVLNYFIKDEFNFPSSYNGYIKAAVGIIGLVSNITINVFIAEKTNIRTSIVYILVLCGISAGALCFIQDIPIFIAVTLIHFTVNAIYLPILQVMATESNDKSNTGTISGTFNAIRSLGMFVGSMIIGFIYAFDKRITFAFIGLIFLIGAVTCMIYRQIKAKMINEG